MTVSRFLIFTLMLILSYPSLGDINATYSIESSTVENLSAKIDSETIILINIDNTLIMPKAVMFLPSNPYHNFIDSLIIASSNKPAFNKIIFNWYTQRKITLVEPGWLQFIEQSKLKGAQVWGLTQMDYKIYELIQKPEEWRYNELARLGIQFNEKLGQQEAVRLSNDPKKQPIFYRGIIFTAKANKGEAILDLLQVGNLRPKKIIIFDNNKNELKSMQRALRKFDIDYYGINYLAQAQIVIKVNSDQMMLQQDTLINQRKWLEDDEVLEALAAKTSSGAPAGQSQAKP